MAADNKNKPMTDTPCQDEFQDIRPYNDGEFPAALARLLDAPEFADTLLSIRHPVLSRYFGKWLRPYIRRILHKNFDSFRCVKDLQVEIGEQMELMLAKSDSTFSVSGIDNLDKNQAYLYISNHRDIAMDPAFVNLSLFKHGMDTVRIAIGDNLLSKPFATDLMRLNKSFIVRRSATGKREKLQALTHLSRYIRHSLLVDGASIWIAQREGRAKDGIDRTEPALLKMLSLGKARGESFAQGMAPLNIVPVAISYMFDPCDRDKARELHQRRTTGSYQKAKHEDLKSLYNGIVGDKGAVHVAYGQPVTMVNDPDELALQMDRQILANYWLHPTNLIAWEKLHGGDDRLAALKAKFPTCDWQDVEAKLLARVAGEAPGVRQVFLEAYANPVQSRFNLDGNNFDGNNLEGRTGGEQLA